MRKENCCQYGVGAAELNVGKFISFLLNLSEPCSAKIGPGLWHTGICRFLEDGGVDLLSPGLFNPKPTVDFISHS